MNSILLADDSTLIRKIMVAALEGEGWHVVSAVDGQDALEKATAGESFDLVITDWHMPRMDGDKLIAELRAMPEFDATPILVLTSESQDHFKQVARDVGANGWLSKPFDPDSLVELAAQLMS